jgi:hypothetical protein
MTVHGEGEGGGLPYVLLFETVIQVEPNLNPKSSNVAECFQSGFYSLLFYNIDLLWLASIPAFLCAFLFLIYTGALSLQRIVDLWLLMFLVFPLLNITW